MFIRESIQDYCEKYYQLMCRTVKEQRCKDYEPRHCWRTREPMRRRTKQVGHLGEKKFEYENGKSFSPHL